jgi:hypothetical protein
LETLKHLSRLETLYWDYNELSLELDAPPIERFDMPSLRHVDLISRQATSITAFLECILFPIDVQISVTYRIHEASDMNHLVSVWDPIAKCCLRDDDSISMELRISSELEGSSIRCGRTMRLHNGTTTFFECATFRAVYGMGSSTHTVDILAPRLMVLPIIILVLDGPHWFNGSASSQWLECLAGWTQVEVLRIVGTSAAEWLFRTLYQAMTASTESSLLLLPNLKVIEYDDGEVRYAWNIPSYDWLETCIRILSARNHQAKSGNKVSAIKHVYFHNMDPRYEGWKEHLEALKAVVVVECVSR